MYAIKVELELNNREKTLMNKHIGFSRFCYNYGLNIYNQLDHKQYPGGSSKKIDLIKKVFTNVTKKNPDFAWTKQLSSRVYQNAFRALKTAFTRYFQSLGKYPKYKKKKNSSSFTVDSSNGVILQQRGKQIKLPTLGVFRVREAIPRCVAQTYAVSRYGDKYYVSFAINAELIPPISHEVNKPIGLDVNLTDGKYCVLSDGTQITFPKPLKNAKTKLLRLQYRNRNKQTLERLANAKRCRQPPGCGNKRTGEKASNNAKKYYKKLALLHKQIAARRNDFLQKLTTDLARKYRHLKIEALNIQGMMANLKLAFHIQDASFYKFKALLENKAKTHGGIVESVDTWYPSSKLCCQCQRKKTDLKLSDRIYQCDSPFCQAIDRDLNSAINLENAPLDKITNRVGSTRINACGQFTADGTGLKQEKNTMERQFLLPLSV